MLSQKNAVYQMIQFGDGVAKGKLMARNKMEWASLGVFLMMRRDLKGQHAKNQNDRESRELKALLT